VLASPVTAGNKFLLLLLYRVPRAVFSYPRSPLLVNIFMISVPRM
jgi:hypothetical protein